MNMKRNEHTDTQRNKTERIAQQSEVQYSKQTNEQQTNAFKDNINVMVALLEYHRHHKIPTFIYIVYILQILNGIELITIIKTIINRHRNI